MYFASNEHEQRFKDVAETLGTTAIDTKAFLYLATSDLLKSANLFSIENGALDVSTVDASKLSSSQQALAELALHLYDSWNDCQTSLVKTIDRLDIDNRKLLLQAIAIRANV